MSRLVWHRRDLRLADNELYHNASRIYSVFVFDSSDYSPRQTGIPDDHGGQLRSVSHGPHFSRRLIDAVHSLKKDLRSLGGDLIVRTGNPLRIISQLAQDLQINEVSWSEVPGYYECTLSDELKKVLLFGGSYRCKVFTTCSLTLAHPDDLPSDPDVWHRLARPNEKRRTRTGTKHFTSYTVAAPNIIDVSPSRFEGMPTIMGDFRRVARSVARVRELFDNPNPQNIAKDFTALETGEVPTLEELTKPLLESTSPMLGILPNQLILNLIKASNAIPHNNGMVEELCIRHLKDFVSNHAITADRNLCDVTNNNSSKLSLPLTLGILSPRQVYHCVKDEQRQHEETHGCSLSDINWLISHMEMRDYFLFNCFREGRSAYDLHPKKKPPYKLDIPREWLPLSESKYKLIKWVVGETGLPLVDAGMKELITTGYTSNRVRQNMVSVLTKDLKLDWRLGAEWYQLCLEDHCVAGKSTKTDGSSDISMLLMHNVYPVSMTANFGNWAYFAGVGGDPKNRHFRTVSQAYAYDPYGNYVRKWIKISSNDTEAALRPWVFERNWPTPIVDPDTQLTYQDKVKLDTLGRISPAALNKS
ncbi:hypothetical protein HJC23_013623 [Cyclotella cryptica]|uniref:Photolyase/cryptochrome alpha/beta domain-containing protein n=1 Tax=Cyclotella cryptica TaxID=29204 RepID=A0ABD3PQI1_9STRA|eukprot:CCRYP_012632-RA/>CCRYP_012632-RA protein AED:0.08 eAED:0.08 QI:0/-1/0/1/-1/1/1/0/587